MTRPPHILDDVTLIWLAIWFIANIVGGSEPLMLDPVNGWLGTLILAVGLDLAAAHATRTQGSSA